MLTTFARQSATILRADTINDHGTPIPDWSQPTRVEIPKCVVQPVGGLEDTAHRDLVESLWRIWASSDTDLLATDRVECDGLVFEVVGQPQVWRGPSPLDHLQATLRRWEG